MDSERLNEIVEASTLMGDVRDALLQRLRAMPKPFSSKPASD